MPPKGVKHADNIQGSEPFHGDRIEEKVAKGEPSENLLEVIDSSGEISMEVFQEPNMMTGSCLFCRNQQE